MFENKKSSVVAPVDTFDMMGGSVKLTHKPEGESVTMTMVIETKAMDVAVLVRKVQEFMKDKECTVEQAIKKSLPDTIELKTEMKLERASSLLDMFKYHASEAVPERKDPRGLGGLLEMLSHHS